MKTVAEARYDVLVAIGGYAGCASMHDEIGKDNSAADITRALDELEQAVRHDEAAQILALSEPIADDDDLVCINGDANCGANDPAEPAEPVELVTQYQLEGGYDGLFWDVCGTSRTREGLARLEWRCPHRYHRIVRADREIVETLDSGGNA